MEADASFEKDEVVNYAQALRREVDTCRAALLLQVQRGGASPLHLHDALTN